MNAVGNIIIVESRVSPAYMLRDPRALPVYHSGAGLLEEGSSAPTGAAERSGALGSWEDERLQLSDHFYPGERLIVSLFLISRGRGSYGQVFGGVAAKQSV